MGLGGVYRWLAKSRTSGEVGDLRCSSGRLPRHRYALLLRPQFVDSLTQQEVAALFDLFDREMAPIAGGTVLISTSDAYGNSDFSEEMHWSIEVSEFFIDRYAVTNSQFYEFVADGGYESPIWWAREALDPVEQTPLDLWVDRTGVPGPRFWCHGQPPRNQLDHPVVGISWFEADAFARWLGKRLPSEGEWMQAAVGGDTVPKNYPWGTEWNGDLANTWQAGFDRTLPVDSLHFDECPAQQMIGNVWEWTQTRFGCWSGAGEWSECDGFRAIKGGAFDTLLTAQASIKFQSGESPLARRHNIGFRCALNLTDLRQRPLDVPPNFPVVTQSDPNAIADISTEDSQQEDRQQGGSEQGEIRQKGEEQKEA